MGYWPSYQFISPEARAGYLAWLAGGRSDPSVYIGFVFLYFYGLERRALIDAQAIPAARAEIPTIAAEVRRLLRLYGGHHSLRSYGSQLLTIIDMLYPETSDGREASRSFDTTPGWELPLALRIAIGRVVAAGRPIGADLALAWYRASPTTTLRTPARRCAVEFAGLFGARYRETYGDGLVVKPPRKRLAATYRPASSSFGGEWQSPPLDLPMSEAGGAR